jgi:hypothetical protein
MQLIIDSLKISVYGVGRYAERKRDRFPTQIVENTLNDLSFAGKVAMRREEQPARILRFETRHNRSVSATVYRGSADAHDREPKACG